MFFVSKAQIQSRQAISTGPIGRAAEVNGPEASFRDLVDEVSTQIVIGSNHRRNIYVTKIHLAVALGMRLDMWFDRMFLCGGHRFTVGVRYA